MSDDLSKVDWGKPTPAEHAGGAYDPDCATCREYADPIAKRMEALVREVAKCRFAGDESRGFGVGSIPILEARAIVSLLPEPVDADLVEARECVAAVYEAANRSDLAKITRDGGQDKRLRVQCALAAIRRGRALERDSREG